ncbi:hypothetical protein SH501x_001435 [Pirellulaceae bacterium SH501]
MKFQQPRERTWENVSRVTAVCDEGSEMTFTVVTISSGSGGPEDVESVVNEFGEQGEFFGDDMIEFPMDSGSLWKISKTVLVSKKQLR